MLTAVCARSGLTGGGEEEEEKEKKKKENGK